MSMRLYLPMRIGTYIYICVNIRTYMREYAHYLHHSHFPQPRGHPYCTPTPACPDLKSQHKILNPTDS